VNVLFDSRGYVWWSHAGTVQVDKARAYGTVWLSGTKPGLLICQRKMRAARDSGVS